MVQLKRFCKPSAACSRGFWVVLAAFLVWSVGTPTIAQVPDDLHSEAGAIVLKTYSRDGVTIGQYYQYLPAGSPNDYQPGQPVGSNPLPIVVLIHGSITSDAQALTTANNYITRSTGDADTLWFMLIAPVFTDTDFNGSFGGYRGLVGRDRSGVEPRKTDADGFVNGILDAYIHKHPEIFPRRAMFYGHSAGGQFLSRYLVTHTDRVAAMAISSAGTYVFPDPSITWTNGMATLDATFNFNGNPTLRSLLMIPMPSRFRRSARLPVTVMVGDSEICDPVPNAGFTPGWNDGSNSCSSAAWSPTGNGTNYRRGELWVEAMRDFAGLNEFDPGVAFQRLRGVAHDSGRTQPVALPVLLCNRPEGIDLPWLGSAITPIIP